MNILNEGKRVFDIEIEALKCIQEALDNTFVQILELVTNCNGKVILTGIGKSGHIASKIAATFSSLGTPAFCLHPADAMHGDLGMISSNDVVIAISYSGESDEVIRILPNIKMIGAVLIAITGNSMSTLAQAADVVQVLSKFKEACYLGLAPTSSTTVSLCYGDALAVVASGIYGFKNVDFGKFHPAGSLGKKLILKVDDIMAKDLNNAVVHESATLKQAIVELSQKGLGIVSVEDNNGFLKGVITNGDLRRQLEKSVNIYELKVNDIMTRTPFTIKKGKLAIEALNKMRDKNISAMPVLNENIICGTIRLHDIIHNGIVE